MPKESVSEPIPADRLLTENPGLVVVAVDHDGRSGDEWLPFRDAASTVALPETLWVVRTGTPPAAPDWQDYIATESRPLRGQALFRVVDWGPDSQMQPEMQAAWNGTRGPALNYLR